MSKQAIVLALLLLLTSSFAKAGELLLEPIADHLACEPEAGAGEYGWMHRPSDPRQRDSAVCLFAQFPDNNDKRPFLRIGGKVVSLDLKRTIGSTTKKSSKWTKTEIFASRDGRFHVSLRSRLERDSCVGNTGSCCGQRLQGELVVRRGQLSKRYRLDRWSGS